MNFPLYIARRYLLSKSSNNAINTVADGIYHMGFEIVCDRFLNEDGNRNASLEDVAFWLNELLEEDLNDGSLSSSTPLV